MVYYFLFDKMKKKYNNLVVYLVGYYGILLTPFEYYKINHQLNQKPIIFNCFRDYNIQWWEKV